MYNIAVIGAGITGITTAYFLARAGHRVTVYDQERYPAMRTSFANGGQVSVSNSETWTTWSNVGKGIKWMFTKDAPLLIRPRLDWAQWKWMAKFLYHTASGDYARNTADTIRLGIESRKLYQQICQDEAIEFDRSDCGIIHFYKDPDYWSNACDVKELYNANGCEWDLLTPGQVQALDPALQDIDGIIGGTRTASDWTGDIHKFCYELANVLKEKYQVQCCYNCTVTDLNDLLEFHDKIVVANGVSSTRLARTVGDKLSVYPVKGYSVTINNVDPKHLPRVSLLDDQAKIVTSTLGNRFRVAGTAELTGENYDILRDRIEPLLAWVHTNFPAINTHDYTSWACLRPMTPNMMPIVEQSKHHADIYYNTGHGHLGWTLAPATAHKITKILG